MSNIQKNVPKLMHTPGPWRFDCGNLQVERAEDRQPICDISTQWDLNSRNENIPFHVSEANAHLIAAAPELLDALKRAIHQLVIQDDEGSAFMQAHRAIAKAEGRAE
jgi:hypothetical protein